MNVAEIKIDWKKWIQIAIAVLSAIAGAVSASCMK